MSADASAGSPDVVGALATVSGIPRQDVATLWDEARANQRRLESCTRHEFERIDATLLRDRYRCTACQGEVTGVAFRWYTIGLTHGGGR